MAIKFSIHKSKEKSSTFAKKYDDDKTNISRWRLLLGHRALFQND